jgi:hypothetical protein
VNRFVPVVEREWPVYFLKDLMLMKCTGDVKTFRRRNFLLNFNTLCI